MMWEKSEPLCPTAGNVKWCSCSGKQPSSPSNVVTMWPSNSAPRSMFSREAKTDAYIRPCTWMFIPALFIITKRWKQSKHPSADKWINKMWSVHTMGYYSAIEEWSIGTEYNMRKHAKWYKPVINIYYMILVIWNVQSRELLRQ